MLPAGYRAEHGIFYTPPLITRRLLDDLEEVGADWTSCRVLDPACGGGAFLAPVAGRMIDALPDAAPGEVALHISEHVRGFELDPFAAWLSITCLQALILDRLEIPPRRVEVDQVVTVEDSLAQSHSDSFDVVVGNPPYGRTELTAECRRIYARSLLGHAN